jgi:glycine/D-amino acid oxidase-like deaminating enzyme
MKLWEGSSRTQLQRDGEPARRLNLYHSDAQRDAYARRGNAMRLHGVDAELLDRDEVARWCPSSISTMRAFPIHGGLLQRRGGTARHDAVAWGYARGADMRGVDIIQNCEVTGFASRRRRHRRRDDARQHRRKKVGVAVAGNTSRVARWRAAAADRSHVLQAFVSEGRSSR